MRDVYNPWYEPAPHAGSPRITFSRVELAHLGIAVALLGAAFSFVVQEGNILRGEFPDTIAIGASLLAVLTGFVLHELAHKVLAQRRGHWAEFRGNFRGLGIALLLAIFLKFLFAAPGAVWIQGRVTPRENGLISLGGPATNVVIAALLLPLLVVLDTQEPIGRTLHIVAFINALLGAFNLIPAGNLDGRKVLDWSRAAYAVAVGLAVAAIAAVLVAAGLPGSA